jgi:nucleotide-binding universal stress UspA family protein
MEDKIESDRILVGVDGSSSSIAALRYAARIAAAFDAPLEAVTTWVYPEYPEYTMGVDWSTERDATETLDRAVETAFGATPAAGPDDHDNAGAGGTHTRRSQPELQHARAGKQRVRRIHRANARVGRGGLYGARALSGADRAWAARIRPWGRT